MPFESAAASAQTVLHGASNFRSLCGLATADGRRIRPHSILRADRLCHLNEADWAALASMNLRTICDLRSAHERETHPNRIPQNLSIREVSLAVDNDLRANSEFMRLLQADSSARGAERVMIEIYRRFPRHMAGKVASLINELCDSSGAVLVHCTAGKDRTGFAIAVLLSALGVSRADIYEDYLRSHFWPGKERHKPSLARRMQHVVPPEAMPAVLDAVLDVRESYLDTAFAAIEADFGNLHRYLAAVGVDETRIRRLHARLLV
jgi:protein-tyrosine phosphatase